MVGYPKRLNTKEDYEYVRTHFHKVEWEKDFENLLTTQYDWFFVRELGVDEKIDVGDERQYKIVTDEERGVNSLYEWQYNENCKLAKVGYTVAEVEGILKEV